MADFHDWNRNFQDDDEDEVLDTYESTTEAFIFAIEATSTMLDITQASNFKMSSPNAPSQSTQLGWKGSADAQSKMELALRAALAMMKRKVISCPKDLVGIIVTNTAETEGGEKNCRIIMPLGRITAARIKALTDLLQDIEAEPESVQSLFMPFKGQNVFPEVISRCSGMFRQDAAGKRMNKRLMLITDNDDPYHGVDSLMEPAAKKLNDFRESAYEFSVLLLPPTTEPDDAFDVEKFYGPVISSGNYEDEYPIAVTDVSATLVAFVNALRSKEAIRRTAFKIPFNLNDKSTIGICGYNLVGEEKKRPPAKVNLNNRVGQDVVLKTYIKDAEGKDVVEPAEIKKCFQIGKADPESGKKATHIFFDDNDMKKLKALGLATGLTLLGFKPRSLMQPDFAESVKHSHFIVPNEETHTGSTRTFAALVQSMLSKNVVGFAVLVPRNNAKPQIVCMLAQEEEKQKGVQIKPPGIHLCQLPYIDDKRDHGLTSCTSILVDPTPEDPEPPQPVVDIVKKMVKQLAVTYNPDNYPNPALNYHYECMAAIALDELVPVNPTDTTVPKYSMINQRVAKYAAELKVHINQSAFDPSMVVTSKAKNPKRPHSDTPAAATGDLTDFVDQLREKGVKITNDVLKQALGLMGEKKSGSKAELYERAIKALKERKKWDDDDGEDSDQDEEKPLRKKKSTRRIADDSDDSD